LLQVAGCELPANANTGDPPILGKRSGAAGEGAYDTATMIAIVDYGMANLRSVQKALEHVGALADIVSKPEQIRRADRIILPGVGAFKDAVATLQSSGLAGPVLDHIKSGKLFLGICLGLQMLFDISYEDGEHRGLGVIGGRCIRFELDSELGLKVPHMGWNQLNFRDPRAPIYKDLPDGCGVYFVHSYHVVPDDPSVIASTTEYGGDFVSSIRRDNIMGTQFHPEKSQAVGLKILENFARM
jgi:glutamine amidotransferase